ncbi:hypothetical protein F4X10_15780 [Candidatus Poribacteria bacterium]|nr:hypothetical protein [Candidatus Poribacteria bacterium]
MPFLQKNRKPVIILGLVILGTGAFLFLNNNSPQEPVIIYKVTQPSLKQKQAQTDVENAALEPESEHNHEYSHDTMPHSHVLEVTPSSEGYDWREEDGFGVSDSKTDPWKQTYTQPAEPSKSTETETYPPPNWHKTEDPELYIQYLRAQLIKQFGDIPQVHIFVGWERERRQGIPIRDAEEYITFLEAQYHLWPSETTLRTLETLRKEKAEGVRIIFRSEK